MKKVLALVVVAMAFSMFASAAQIEYGTAGTFACNAVANCSVNGSQDTITVGTVSDHITINFAGVIAGITGFANAPYPDQESMGTFTVNNTPNNSTVSLETFTGATFTLTVNQTVPSGVSGTIPGTMTGTLKYQNSQLLVTFGNGSTVGSGPASLLLVDGSGTGAFYQLTNLNSGTSLKIAAAGSLSAETTLKADITGVPEPGSMLLLGSGLSGLAGLIRRRKK